MASTGPLIPRRRLGAAFKALREARRETLQQTATALMFSPSKLSRIENGQAGEPHPRDVRDLIAHFQPAEAAEVDRLLALAAAGRVPGWWQSAPYKMPSRLDTYIAYESAASSITAYVPTVVPGLLQTREYAASTLRRIVPSLSPDEVEMQVEIRMRRQEEWRSRIPPAHTRYIIPETVLRRPADSPEGMKKQLESLLDIYAEPRVDLHIIPFAAGIYEAVELSATTVFSFDDSTDPNVVVIERPGWSDFLDRPAALEKYTSMMARMSHYWLSRDNSRKFLAEVLQS